MKKLFLLAVVVLVLASTSFSHAAEVTVGAEVPEFTVTDTNGNQHSLSDFKDKYVVLEWFNYGCPFVKKHYDSGNMQALQKKYTQQGVVWLSICSSAEGNQGYYQTDELNQMAEEKGVNSTAVVRDAEGALGRMFGAATTPHMFVIGPDGVLLYQGAIDSVPGTDQAELSEALNYIELTLDAALIGAPVEIPSTKSYGCSVKY